VRFLGPWSKEDKGNRGRENGLCVLPTHTAIGKEEGERERKACACREVRKRENKMRIDRESGVELSTSHMNPSHDHGPHGVKDSWTRGV
jgi:hypothetical protein